MGVGVGVGVGVRGGGEKGGNGIGVSGGRGGTIGLLLIGIDGHFSWAQIGVGMVRGLVWLVGGVSREGREVSGGVVPSIFSSLCGRGGRGVEELFPLSFCDLGERKKS